MPLVSKIFSCITAISDICLGGLSIDTVKFIMDNDISYEILEYLQTELEMKLRKEIVPRFWKWFKERADDMSHDYKNISAELSTSSNELDRNEDTFVRAVKELYSTVTRCIVYAQRLDQLAEYFQKVISMIGGLRNR